jgi:hypothetical protein
MFSRNVAEVVSVTSEGLHCEELLVSITGKNAKAVNYIPLTGPALPGDEVVLNTTAVELRLGSGGYHFVLLNLNRPEQPLSGGGHLMKLRYTPVQLRVLSVEEEQSPHHDVMMQATSLDGIPVAVAELHSMLAPLAILIKKEKPGARLAYLMTDGGALPAFFSRTVRELRERQLICGTVTVGHAFGGDLEAVTVHSGLLAARHVLHADAVIISMGPGVAGTGTPFGFSGLEAGDNINRVHCLNGHAVMVPRISFADTRKRHQGVSHHTLTALTRAALVPADVPFPVLTPEEDALLASQIYSAGLETRHRVFHYSNVSLQDLEHERHLCSTMGRSLTEDSAFFLAVAAAARHMANLLNG